MPKVNEIRTALFEAAPEYMKMEWDNVGLMCGHAAQEVTRVLVALDASYRVLNEAQAAHCELVVCHPLQRLDGVIVHDVVIVECEAVVIARDGGRSVLFIDVGVRGRLGRRRAVQALDAHAKQIDVLGFGRSHHAQIMRGLPRHALFGHNLFPPFIFGVCKSRSGGTRTA